MIPSRRAEAVGTDDDGIRLDRWLRERWPGLPYGQIQRLIRTGQVRVDGHRARSHRRLAAGQTVRIPPVPAEVREPGRPEAPGQRARAITDRILYRDDHFLALDKPAGLAVQGGTGIAVHLDGMLDALRFGAEERPRLVHRLDRGTTGVLLLARSRRAARHCARVFREGLARKTYWALVDGVPDPRSGHISGYLRKHAAGGERNMIGSHSGQAAATHYRTRDSANGTTWLELHPVTGRTHQLRVHCAMLGCPIQGDRKYGAAGPGRRNRLQLHAREIAVPDLEGFTLRIAAPVPASMGAAFQRVGFRSAGLTAPVRTSD